MIREDKTHRMLARLLVSILVAIIIFSTGILATAYQVRQSERQDASLSAHKAILRIDALLSEAEEAANKARPLLGKICDPGTISQLNKLTIETPHLRVLSLLQGEYLTCSSFGTSMPRAVDLSHYANHRLSLRPGSVISPDSPMMILLTTFPEGSVASSLDAVHLTDVLSLLSSPQVLTLQAGDTFLLNNGSIARRALPASTINILSPNYPYSVRYPNPALIPLTLFLEKGKILLAVFAILSALAAAAIWRISFPVTTPYDQLSDAITKGEIIPWYQPIVCSKTGEIYGVEILARWHHASGIHIPPDAFIPLAEKSGLIIPLTTKLMQRTARELGPVVNRFHQPFHIGFNISAAHIQAKDSLLTDVMHFQSSFPDGSIQTVLEITEREPFELSPNLDELLKTLRSKGIKIALDDFGTGYSNLGYLNTLPIDYIKIDRSFVNRIIDENNQDKLVECVISMAKTLGIDIVAEGIETRYQMKWLVQQEVDLLQGYYFSRPLPAHQLIKMVALQRLRFKEMH